MNTPKDFVWNEDGQLEHRPNGKDAQYWEDHRPTRAQERRGKIGCACLFTAILAIMFLLMNWNAERDYYKQLYRLDNCAAKHYTIQECKDNWTK